jgi:hypothetical protein
VKKQKQSGSAEFAPARLKLAQLYATTGTASAKRAVFSPKRRDEQLVMAGRVG